MSEDSSDMPAHIDIPNKQTDSDPEYLWVQGWVWLNDLHDEIQEIEAWIGSQIIGRTNTLYIRPDVAAAFALPPDKKFGFTIAPQAIPSTNGKELDVFVSVVLRNGLRLPHVASVTVSRRTNDVTPLKKLRSYLNVNSLGLEIGAHSNPTPFVNPFYTDTVQNYAGSEGKVDFLSDARSLPLRDASLDYICSSHVLEHLPNPVGALLEWCRVLKTGGLLYLIVPDQRFTFDRTRRTTPLFHIINDYVTNTTKASPDDIHEFLYQTDWSLLRPDCPNELKSDFQVKLEHEYLTKSANQEDIGIHYHTFTPESLQALLLTTGLVGGKNSEFEVLASAGKYPPDRGDGIALLLRKIIHVRMEKAQSTFELSHRLNDALKLPLRCPSSLLPLSISGNNHELVEGLKGRSYPISDGVPSLLPDSLRSPKRSWNRLTQRLTKYLYAYARNLRTIPQIHE